MRSAGRSKFSSSRFIVFRPFLAAAGFRTEWPCQQLPQRRGAALHYNACAAASEVVAKSGRVPESL
jgi:hypothetical protein